MCLRLDLNFYCNLMGLMQLLKTISIQRSNRYTFKLFEFFIKYFLPLLISKVLGFLILKSLLKIIKVLLFKFSLGLIAFRYFYFLINLILPVLGDNFGYNGLLTTQFPCYLTVGISCLSIKK